MSSRPFENSQLRRKRKRHKHVQNARRRILNISRFADQEAQKELEDMREKTAKIEKMLSVTAELPGFGNLMEEAAKKPS